MKNNEKEEAVQVTVHYPIPPLGRTDLVFFHKGDLVKHKRLEHSPKMLVDSVLFEKNKDGNFATDSYGNKKLLGIKCCWFNSSYDFREQVFNSKDLTILDSIKLEEKTETL